MKYILGHTQIRFGFIIAILLGIVVGYNIDYDFVPLYISKMSQSPVRYSVIILILYVDYLVFENTNHYVFVFRNQSVMKFLYRSMAKELVVSFLLLVSINIPIIIMNFNIVMQNLSVIFLFIINGIVVMGLFICLIRCINIWVNNRILSTGVFLTVYISLDTLLDHYNFYIFDTTIFDFSYLLTLPFRYATYPFMISIMMIGILLLLILSKKLLIERDFILKNYENN